MKTITIYGIKNCDTMKKAFDWFKVQNLDYIFHDYKKQGVPSGKLRSWCETHDWKTLINTKGPTWRKLTVPQQDITSVDAAVALMQEYSSVIRRPIFETGEGEILVGYDPVRLEAFVR